MLDDLEDKELEFNGQLAREILIRQPDERMGDLLRSYLTSAGASLVVVPSIKLCGVTQADLGTVGRPSCPPPPNNP